MSDVFDRAPKVELHLHLEGAIPLPTLWELVDGYGDSGVQTFDALASRFQYRDFPHFIETWWWMTGFLRTSADFSRAARAVASTLAEQNIIYAEASFSPADLERHGLSPQRIAVAIRRGLDRVVATQVVLNIDLVRDTGPDHADRTLESVLEIKEDADVRGITIGGSEQTHPPAPFASIFRRAESAGLRLTAHAGEAAGPESMWSALRDLGVERIGHGVRAVEDPELLEHLVVAQIPLEVCPTSNICTGIADGWAEHPVHELLEVGANVTINSDDPTFFNCTLAGELRSLFAAEPVRSRDVTLAAVEASWLGSADKERLSGSVRDWWAGRNETD